MASADVTTTTDVNDSDVSVGFEPYEFLMTQPLLSILLIIVLVIASVVGTCGNILILVAVATHRNLQNVESVFIVNLACSDLYITVIADPFSIVGKTVGWRFFDAMPELCRIVGSMCTISCIGSLMTLSTMSCNRCVLICYRRLYRQLFTTRNSVVMCCCFYTFGSLLVCLNFLGVGDHSFDHKSLECIWDRMANHEYTIVFGMVVLLLIFVTGLAYLRLYLHVRKSRVKMHSHGKPYSSSARDITEVSLSGPKLSPLASASSDALNNPSTSGGKDETKDESEESPRVQYLDNKNNQQQDVRGEESGLTKTEEDSINKIKLEGGGPQNENRQQAQKKTSQSDQFDPESGLMDNQSREVGSTQSSTNSKSRRRKRESTLRLARALFVIYLVFVACWLPFSLLIMLDADDTFSHELHVTIVAWAHLHPSLNWLVYYHTHTKFRAAFRRLLRIDKCFSF